MLAAYFCFSLECIQQIKGWVELKYNSSDQFHFARLGFKPVPLKFHDSSIAIVLAAVMRHLDHCVGDNHPLNIEQITLQ